MISHGPPAFDRDMLMLVDEWAAKYEGPDVSPLPVRSKKPNDNQYAEPARAELSSEIPTARPAAALPVLHSQKLASVPAEQTQCVVGNTKTISGREAVPLRLLPFATRWITSKRWLEIFRHKDEEMVLTARHQRDGYVLDEIPISVWVKLDDLAPFPPKAFVWRDELESAYSAHFRSDNDLLLDAPLREQDRKWVFEGFDALQIDASGMPTEREIWAISYNNANPVRWDLLEKFDRIKKREAILYMHGLNPDEHAAIKAGLSDEAVPDAMPRRVADSEEAKCFFIDVSKALKIASSGKMKKLTAAEWVVWATKKGIQVHSKFRAIAEWQDKEKHLEPGTSFTEISVSADKEAKPDALSAATQVLPAMPDEPPIAPAADGNNINTGNDWITKAREFAKEYIDRHKKRNLFPSQSDVCNYVQDKLRDNKIYGAHRRPVSATYIGRNAIQGEWWKKNKP